MTEDAKHLFDAVSIATILGTISALLPPLAALISIIWGCIRIFETKTVQGLLGRRRESEAE